MADVAKACGYPVEMEGSILSHVYYMLQRNNVTVRCYNLPEQRETKHVFGKLVRDLVPEKIRKNGETAAILEVDKSALHSHLKKKALEESYELYSAQSPSEEKEEMADIMEVLLSLLALMGLSLDDLLEVTRKKRDERGGFTKGVILIDTKTVPLIPTARSPTHNDNSRLFLTTNLLEEIYSSQRVVSSSSQKPQQKNISNQIVLPLIPNDGTNLKVYVDGVMFTAKIKYDASAKSVALTMNKEQARTSNVQQSLFDE